MINAIINVEVVLSAALVWVFVVAYHLSATWYRSYAGRLVMLTNTVFGLMLTLVSVQVVFPHAVNDAWYRLLLVTLFSGVPATFVAQLVLLYRSQLRSRCNRGVRSAEIR